MTLETFLQELMLAGTELWVEDGELQVREPKDGLSPAQRAQLAHAADEIMRILPTFSFDAPLSYGQEALWLVQQANADSLAYNTGTLLHMDTATPIEVWRGLFQRLIHRHGALRTTFTLREDLPVQVIHATQPVHLEEIDLSGHDPSRETLIAAVEEAVWRPYDLEQGPLFRVFVFTQSPTSQTLLLSSHHIINDGFSQWVLIDELLTLYALAHGIEADDLTPLQYTYPRFVEKERQHIAAKGPELRAWWRETLAGELPILDLPVDYPRQPRTNGRADAVPLHLPADLRDQVRLLARASGVSFFNVLLGALQVLLHRHSGQDEVIVGVPTAGREAEYGQTFGDFINPVPVRGHLENVPFVDFLQQLRGQLTAALAHRDYPFSLLVQDFPGVRGSGRTPIFQSALIAQQIRNLGDKAVRLLSGEELQIGGLACSFIGWWPGGGDVDLTVDLMERHDGLVGYIRYNPDLFTPATMTRLGESYRHLLTNLVADPSGRIGEVSILTAEQRRQMLVDWNGATVDFPEETCVHQLFEAQAARSPDAVAVTCPGDDRRDATADVGSANVAVYLGSQSLTYRQLNDRANQIAHSLQTLGVGPETLVGICLDRSPLVLAAVLGVLKAGAAYVPIDPEYPSQRIAHMLTDSQLAYLVTTSNLRPTLAQAGSTAQTVLLLDTEAPVWAADAQNLDLPISPDRLAYVIYTSGSTGQPKGAMVTHGNFVNAYRGWEIGYQLNGDGQTPPVRAHLQMASFSFDVFGGDMVRALCSGGKLVLCPRSWLLEAEQLYSLMRAEGVDCAEFVPAVLRNLVDYLDESGQDLAFMRLLIAGSDVWYGEEYRRLLRFCGPQTRLINSYGITETTIDSTFFELTPAMESARTQRSPLLADGALVPIGRPFANIQLYVLDQHRQPVPPGVVGDLYIGGAGVSRGYLNRPELTASRFLTLDVEGAPQRVYSTGDRARWVMTESGLPVLAFLGRGDTQVKIRGYRVELGEIETVLTAHDAVQQAVVVARAEANRAARLVAYVVPAAADADLGAILRGHLQQKLPEYMAPSAIVILAELPLTPNGKVDRRALPAPDSVHTDRGALTPPRTETEERLAQIWCDVLQLPQIGVEDNFFDMGGHSLLALQVVNRAKTAFQVNLSLRSLFDAPTVARLASQIEQQILMRVVADRDAGAPIDDAEAEAWEEIAI
jgi:amino acid adenylation domain-containing protein